MTELLDGATDTAQPPSVLLVDDETSILSALKRTLRSTGVTLLTASSGAEGLQLLEQHPVDLIISDMRMPHMSGSEFLAQASQRFPSVVRILLTGFADLESTIAAINEGKIAQYLTKPWNDDELRDIVSKHLKAKLLEVRNRQLSQELLEKNIELEALNSQLEEKVAERTEELRHNHALLEKTHDSVRQSYEHMVALASSIAGLRNPVSYRADQRKAAMAFSLAQAMGLSDSEATSVREAVLLANLGKVGFPDTLLNKPFASLDAAEAEQFRQYPVLGETALMGIPNLEQASRYIRHQFERYDGTGFPDQLRGDQIPLGCRIMSVVRDYLDLVLGYYTGSVFSEAQALREIERFSGVLYDTEVVEAFKQQHFNQDEDDDAERIVSAAELQPGMVLSRHLFSNRGIALLREGQVLDHTLITKLKHLETMAGEPLHVLVARVGEPL
ncbi:HD domain-containing phosphohydrolase [Bacterioplanes sanyensis]|nr:HD domain-containing phosphohydrolase [Bacterioplanes sanyensis]